MLIRIILLLLFLGEVEGTMVIANGVTVAVPASH
jgi:hypothetical protein